MVIAPRIPAALWLTLAACGPKPPEQPVAIAPPSCGERLLESFDPGVPVRSRVPLQPMTQAIGSSSEHVVELECASGENDASCSQRAEESARASYPNAALTASVDHDSKVVRARLRLDGKSLDREFDTLAALAAQLDAYKQEGRTVLLESAAIAPKAGARRFAVVRASVQAKSRLRTELRHELVLAATAADPVALLAVMHAAARSSITIKSWDRQDGGDLRLEIACIAEPS
jgi:hypothetical protein